MGRYKFVVFSNAAEGQDEAFNHWYDTVHLDEVLALPGFTGAQRYRVHPKDGQAPRFGYLALYDIEAEDPVPILDDLKARAARGDLRMSDTLAGTETMLVEELPRQGG